MIDLGLFIMSLIFTTRSKVDTIFILQINTLKIDKNKLGDKNPGFASKIESLFEDSNLISKTGFFLFLDLWSQFSKHSVPNSKNFYNTYGFTNEFLHIYCTWRNIGT